MIVAREPDFLHTHNKGADQPVHPRIIVSAFIIRFLVSVTTKLVTS